MAGERHEISIVVRGDAMEPLADVAPEGPVAIVISNESDHAHDFSLVRLETRVGAQALPENTTISDVPGVESGGGRTAEVHLSRGRYLLLLDPGEPAKGETVLDLTVQPIEGEAP